MARNKLVHVKIWGSTDDHEVADLLDRVHKATVGLNVVDAKDLGAHGDDTPPEPHATDGKGNAVKGAAAGAEITVSEHDVDKLVAALNKIPNIQVEVFDAKAAA